MSIYFISDLHLSQNFTSINKLFDLFIERYAVNATALYILGDFFDYWIGDDYNSKYVSSIKFKLKQLSSQGVKTFIMPGNRDFLIGRKFCQQSGCQYLDDPSIINLGNKRVLLAHGDALCSLDIAYQRFRKIMRNKILNKFFLLLPLKLRICIAKYLRSYSKKHTPLKYQIDPKKYQVPEQSAIKWLTKYSATVLIHGHTHKPKHIQIKQIGDQGKHVSLQHIVLSDWSDKASILRYEHNKAGFELVEISGS